MLYILYDGNFISLSVCLSGARRSTGENHQQHREKILQVRSSLDVISLVYGRKNIET